MSRVQPLAAKETAYLEGGPAFSLANRVHRALWRIAWALLAQWTPPPLHAWRRLLLRAFGARMSRGARVYGTTIVWYPPNLTMGEFAIMGPHVNCYNQDQIDIGEHAVVSQTAYLCCGTHDISDPYFQLKTRPIAIGARSWVAAGAFIGPGVTVGEGAVVAARAAVFGDVAPWTVQSGNPARFLKRRVIVSQD